MSQPAQIDPRGQRFNAAVTAVVVASAIVALAVLPSLTIALVAFQAGVFAVGAFYRLTASPYAYVYTRSIRPRIGPPRELEASGGPVLGHVLGAALLAAALVALTLGAPLIAYGALALVLFAALLNASVGLCLGCELHLVLQRLQTSKV